MSIGEQQLLDTLHRIAEIVQEAGSDRRSGQQTDPLAIDVRGDIFEIHAEWRRDDANPVPGSLSIEVANGSGEWIDLIVESVYPQTSQIWQTGRLENGASTATTPALEMRFHIGKALHVKRWRPGLFGIPGDGGGEVYLELPQYGDVTITISDTG